MLLNDEIFGLVKPSIDVHTLGISTIANLLRDCGYRVIIAPDEINRALENMTPLDNIGLIIKWIRDERITRLGFSYRLDPNNGCDIFLSFREHMISYKMFEKDGGTIREIFFAGLPDTCNMIKGKLSEDINLFPGDESPLESLSQLGVPENKIPKTLNSDNDYDKSLWSFATELIASERYKLIEIPDHYGYKSCGMKNDSYVDRLNYARKKNSLPLIRAHVGPYNPDSYEAIKEFKNWVHLLANSKFLDVLSIGSSQLTQSNFGENWDGLPNGGGVPINSELEYSLIKNAASPMLVRTYSGTSNLLKLAEIHERSLNISWHALSLWWFCEIDGRGANSVIDNLHEHIETIKYIASTKKPMEPNVPHHFSFRGADDITFIISGYLSAKIAKKFGIKNLILQNMLNTPKYTWGVQDLAKARAMLKLVKGLEDADFSVSLQTRAGLDYFSPDLEKAMIQLSAVTALMDDIEPCNDNSPEIIHVVSYSEAIRLATPPVIIESIQITLSALREYRLARTMGKVIDMRNNFEVQKRSDEMYEEALESIKLLEKFIPNLYTADGLFKIFEEGFFPIPYLMNQRDKYTKAVNYTTAVKNGGVRVVDDQGEIVNTVKRYKRIIDNIV